MSELEPGEVYDDVSELPRWIQILLDEQFEKAYRQGWEEGQRSLWYRLESDLKKGKPYGA